MRRAATALLVVLVVGCSGTAYSSAGEVLDDLVMCQRYGGDPESDTAACETEEGIVSANISSSAESAELFIAMQLDEGAAGLVVWDLDRIIVIAPNERRADAIADRIDGRVISTASDLRS